MTSQAVIDVQELANLYKFQEVRLFGLDNVPPKTDLYSCIGFNLKMVGYDWTKKLIEEYLQDCHVEGRTPHPKDLVTTDITERYLGPEVHTKAHDMAQERDQVKERFTNKNLTLPRDRWIALRPHEKQEIKDWADSSGVTSIERLSGTHLRTPRHMKYGLTNTQFDSLARMAQENGLPVPALLQQS